VSRNWDFRVWPTRTSLHAGAECRNLGGEAVELCSHWGFLISVDSDIESDLDRSQAARHFLIDGTALEGIDLEMPANHAHAKPARGLQGLLDSARGRGPGRRVAVSHGTRDLGRVGHVLVRNLLVNGCARFVLLSLKGARQGNAVLRPRFRGPWRTLPSKRWARPWHRSGGEPGLNPVQGGGCQDQAQVASAMSPASQPIPRVVPASPL
jgi:hypothetical protein